jgi:hypothetical protein
MRNNEVGLQRKKLLRESLHRWRVGCCHPANIDANVAVLRPPERLESLAKRREAGLCSRVAFGQPHQHTDPPHLSRLLGPDRSQQAENEGGERRGGKERHAPPAKGCTSASSLRSILRSRRALLAR